MTTRAIPEPVMTAEHARIRLALAILQHRRFCHDCTRHIDQAVLALLGATIEEIMERSSQSGRI